MCAGNNLEKTLWVGSVGSVTLEPAHCFHWSRNMSSPSITSDFHLALATQIHIDLDWTEFKRNVSSEILEFCPLGILSIRRSTLWRCFICWNILVPNKIQACSRKPSRWNEHATVRQPCTVHAHHWAQEKCSLFLLLFLHKSLHIPCDIFLLNLKRQRHRRCDNAADLSASLFSSK